MNTTESKRFQTGGRNEFFNGLLGALESMKRQISTCDNVCFLRNRASTLEAALSSREMAERRH